MNLNAEDHSLRYGAAGAFEFHWTLTVKGKDWDVSEGQFSLAN